MCRARLLPTESSAHRAVTARSRPSTRSAGSSMQDTSASVSGSLFDQRQTLRSPQGSSPRRPRFLAQQQDEQDGSGVSSTQSPREPLGGLCLSRVGGNRRVPHVRPSVRGTKKMGAAQRSLSPHRPADSYNLPKSIYHKDSNGPARTNEMRLTEWLDV
jgi:hypothetical protein